MYKLVIEAQTEAGVQGFDLIPMSFLNVLHIFFGRGGEGGGGIGFLKLKFVS